MRRTNEKLIGLLIGVVFVFAISIFGVNNISVWAMESEKQLFEEKIYSHTTIDEDFDDSSVLVVMDKNTGGINKIHKESFFGSFKKEYISDLTIITGDPKAKGINEDKFRQILEIKLPENNKENVLSAIRQLEKVEGIRYVGPNHYLYPMAEPNDTRYQYGGQWGLNKANGIQGPAAWDIVTGSSNVRVGIIDSGIAAHPDLNANLVAGWNFVGNNDNTNDTHGHGTHVAGIVGAVGNNNEGIAGVCWNVSLVPLKISNSGTGNNTTPGRVIDAITYAENNDIEILNFSWGGNGFNSQALKDAIEAYSGLFVQPVTAVTILKKSLIIPYLLSWTI